MSETTETWCDCLPGTCVVEHGYTRPDGALCRARLPNTVITGGAGTNWTVWTRRVEDDGTVIEEWV